MPMLDADHPKTLDLDAFHYEQTAQGLLGSQNFFREANFEI